MNKKVEKIMEKYGFKHTTDKTTRKIIEEAYKKGQEDSIPKKVVLEKINKIERSNWDCSKRGCGLVNNNADVCKSCGSKKEDSYDNYKLEELKRELFEGGAE